MPYPQVSENQAVLAQTETVAFVSDQVPVVRETIFQTYA
jgi:hypothetical protein